MAKTKSPSRLSNSKIVLKVIVRRLKTQKTQLDSLLRDRNLLQDIVKLQQQRFASHQNLLQHQFFQMNRKLTIQDMERKIAAAKSDLILGLSQTKPYAYQLENADSELGDFREWFDILSLKLSELKDMPKLTEEVKRLKSANEKLSLQQNSEISALLAEKNYAWSQHNEMESSLKEQLQEKDAILECENKKIQMISSDIEELRSSYAEKDRVIEQLRSEMAKLEADSIIKNETIAKLSKELESLKSSRVSSATPLPRRCSSRRGKNTATDNKVVTVNKESDSQTHGKLCRSWKGKAVEMSGIANTTPRLFTSSFKVPKLKSASQVVV